MSEPTKKQLQDELAEVNREWAKALQELERLQKELDGERGATSELFAEWDVLLRDTRQRSRTVTRSIPLFVVLLVVCGWRLDSHIQRARDAVIAAMPKATIPELTKDHFPTIEHCPQGQIRHSGDTAICIHRVTVSAPVGCWLGAGATDEDTLKRYPLQSFDWWQGNDGAQLHVRSGCVGKVRYSVDGVEVHPANLSKSSKTEVVRLP